MRSSGGALESIPSNVGRVIAAVAPAPHPEVREVGRVDALDGVDVNAKLGSRLLGRHRAVSVHVSVSKSAASSTSSMGAVRMRNQTSTIIGA
jgi:hypothetical protein